MRTTDVIDETRSHAESPAGPGLHALIGVVAGLVLVAVAQVAALGAPGRSAPFVAVGGGFIDVIPPWVKDLAIAWFGTRDKLALFISMGSVYLAICAVAGALTRRSLWIGQGILAALGVFASAVVLTRADSEPASVLPTVVGVLTGGATMWWLWRSVHGGDAGPADDVPASMQRRRLLVRSGGLVVLAAVAGAAGVMVDGARRAADAARAAFRVPTPTDPLPPVPAGAQSPVRGMPPVVTPNGEFYRIDTALSVPRLDPIDWQLRITGLVDREVTITWDELLAMPMTEADVTLTCVSNAVGGGLAGQARWIGVPVRDLLERAGVRPEADMVLSRSVDGFTASTPIEALTDERAALVAVAMNGEALPPEHGYPARLVVPGLYGYVSATKWVTELKATTFARDTAYWTDRGWSERGPIKTASRIDVPRDGDQVAAGPVALGGTAWAQTRGISRVEVSIDDGPWREAQLADELGLDAWRQWSLIWEDATPGRHTARVRCIDGTGSLQTEDHADPAPDGASGWHSVGFTVR